MKSVAGLNGSNKAKGICIFSELKLVSRLVQYGNAGGFSAGIYCILYYFNPPTAWWR